MKQQCLIANTEFNTIYSNELPRKSQEIVNILTNSKVL